MTCPTCGAAMRLKPDAEYLVCDYCGNMHFPEPNAEGVRVLGETASEMCPVCSIPLVHASVAGHRLRYCTRCHGTLIEMDDFMAVIENLRSRRESTSDAVRPLDWKDLDRHINCPQCGRTMDTHPYGGAGNLIIDDCESCSLNWLDYGELDKIVRAPDPHVLQ